MRLTGRRNSRAASSAPITHENVVQAGRHAGQRAHMEKVQGFCEADYPLNPVATRLVGRPHFYQSFRAAIPFAQHLAGLEQKFRPLAHGGAADGGAPRLSFAGELEVDHPEFCPSACDCPIVHPLLQRQSRYMSSNDGPARPTYLGGRMDLREGVRSLPWTAPSAARFQA